MRMRDSSPTGCEKLVAFVATRRWPAPVPAVTGVVDHATLQRAALAALGDRFADLLSTEELLSLPTVSGRR
jgi:hypothetical protein